MEESKTQSMETAAVHKKFSIKEELKDMPPEVAERRDARSADHRSPRGPRVADPRAGGYGRRKTRVQLRPVNHLSSSMCACMCAAELNATACSHTPTGASIISAQQLTRLLVSERPRKSTTHFAHRRGAP